MTCRDCIHYDICVFHIKGDENKKCCHFKNKADVVEIEKMAEILADVTGFSPCDLIGNEWLVSCCESVGHCCQMSDTDCWVQYLKHYKERSENNG